MEQLTGGDRALEDYVNLESIIPDYVCQHCRAWINEEDLTTEITFDPKLECPECEKSSWKTQAEIRPVEYDGPMRERVVRI